jgi:hypothetical protein
MRQVTMSIRNVSAVTLMLLLSGIAGSQERGGGPPSQGAAPGLLGSALGDIAKMPDLFRGTWMTYSSFVESDAKLNVPYTAKAQKHVDAYKNRRDIPYSEEGCRSPGLPISMRTGPISFAYAPGLISIYMGTVGNARFIRMNQQMGPTMPKYYGTSVGHWEGDTLVIETENFVPEVTFQYGVGKPMPPLETMGQAPRGGGGAPGGAGRGGPPGGGPPGGAARGGARGGPGSLSPIEGLSAAIWGPHGPGMRMVERMRVINPDTLEVNLTVYDDTVWTKPYVTQTRNYGRSATGLPSEWICTVSITSFDPETNTYNDKDPEEMVKFLDKLGR